MWKKLIQAVVAGLMIALVVLFFLPKERAFLLSFFASQPVSYQEAVRIASPAVVNVYSRAFSETYENADHPVNNLGSGVIMSENGYILTNKHVIQDAEQIIVAMQSGKIFMANLIGDDELTDLAVLKINALEKLPTIPQNLSRSVAVGDVVLAIGNPYNLGQSVSQGIVSAIGRNTVGHFALRQDLIQTDASINRGNSGGALINSLGELVGISTLSLGKNTQDLAEGLNFAIPIELANHVMKEIIQHGYVVRGYLGVESDVFFHQGQGGSLTGVVIKGILPESPADLAGMQVNDVVTHFNGEQITTPAQLVQRVTKISPNTEVALDILRKGQKITLRPTLCEYVLDEEKY